MSFNAAMLNFGLTLESQGKLKEAEILLRQTLHKALEISGPIHPRKLRAIVVLRWASLKQDSFAEAQSLLRKAHDGLERTMGSLHIQTLGTLQRLALALRGLNLYDEALDLLANALSGLRKTLGDDSKNTRECWVHLVEVRSFLNARAAFKEQSEWESSHFAMDIENGRHVKESTFGRSRAATAPGGRVGPSWEWDLGTDMTEAEDVVTGSNYREGDPYHRAFGLYTLRFKGSDVSR